MEASPAWVRPSAIFQIQGLPTSRKLVPSPEQVSSTCRVGAHGFPEGRVPRLFNLVPAS